MTLLLSHCETWQPPGLPSLFSGSGEASSPSAPSSLKSAGRTESGEMSWYSVRTNGGTRTASGEKLSDKAFTAAHRTLPFGTKVKVTNLRNDRTAVVRINDRGPFIEGRIVDVSLGAARKLDFVGSGVAPCRIEVLEGTLRARER